MQAFVPLFRLDRKRCTRDLTRDVVDGLLRATGIFPDSARKSTHENSVVHERVLGDGPGQGKVPTDAQSREGGGQDAAELDEEVLVHPGVEERVVDRRAHRDDVRREERQQEVVPLLDLGVVLEQEEDDVQRKPAADEDDRHGDQHPVRPLLPDDLLLLAFGARVAAGRAACPRPRPGPQRQGDARVAVGDHSAGEDVLEDEAGDGEELAGGAWRPLLVADVDLFGGEPGHLLVDGQW